MTSQIQNIMNHNFTPVELSQDVEYPVELTLSDTNGTLFKCELLLNSKAIETMAQQKNVVSILHKDGTYQI